MRLTLFALLLVHAASAQIDYSKQIIIVNRQYRYTNTPFQQYRFRYWEDTDPMGSDVKSLVVDHRGAAWYGTRSGLYREQGDDVTRFPIYSVVSSTVDTRGDLWFVCGDTVVRYDGTGWKVMTTGVKKPWCIRAAADGRVVLTGNGISIYDHGVWKPQHFPGVSGEAFFAALDTKGRLWVGTSAHGAYVIEGSTVKKLPLKGMGIRDMAEDPEGNLWFATVTNIPMDEESNKHECLARMDASGRWSLYTITNSGLPSGGIHNLCYNPADHALWLTIPDVGIVRFDRGKDWQIFTPRNADLPSSNTKRISVDADGNIWCALMNGLVRVSRKKQ